MEILVVRHGQSIADIQCRHEGRADFELTELGSKQAEAVAKWINSKYKLDVIYSSPLKRACKTAEWISATTDVPVIYDDSLMEWDNGLLAGLLRTEAMEMFPLPKGGRKPHDESANTESMINFRARAEMFWSKLLDRHTDEKSRICIVSHGGMINMLFRCLMMLPINSECSISTGDTGVHLWGVNGVNRWIIFSNSQQHLIETGKFD